MTEFETTVNKANMMYLKEEIRNILGDEVKLLANFKSVVAFPKDADYKTVKASLQIILKDLEQRIKYQEKQQEKTNNQQQNNQ